MLFDPFFEYFCWSFLVQLNLAQVRYIEGKLDEVWMWVGWGEVEAVSYAGVCRDGPSRDKPINYIKVSLLSTPLKIGLSRY